MLESCIELSFAGQFEGLALVPAKITFIGG